jgi:hypothetical protein
VVFDVNDSRIAPFLNVPAGVGLFDRKRKYMPTGDEFSIEDHRSTSSRRNQFA